MSSLLVPLAAALFLSGASLSSVHSAAHAEEAAPEASSSEGEADTIISEYFRNLSARRFEEALKAVDQLTIEESNRRGQAFLAVMRGSALMGLKRDEQAKEQFAAAERLAPNMPEFSQLGFDTAMAAGRYDVAADFFDRLVSQAPALVRQIDQDRVWHFLRNAPKDQETRNEDRRVALARLGYREDDYLASAAILILVKRGDLGGANELLIYVDEPQLVEDMLINKRMAALWPRLETLAGPGLEKVRAASAASAERAYAAAPEDHEKLQVLINALRHAGRHQEAIALRSKLPSTPDGWAKAEEQLGWAANNVALALAEVGLPDDADALFKLLNDAPIENGRWRVSMKINRLELLASTGKFERALTLLDVTETSATNDGNPYAQQLVRRLRYCILSGLGRKDEAAKLLPELLKHAKDAPGPTIDGLLCAGQIDQAERLALESLADERFVDDFIRSLQARPLTSDDPSVWRQGWVELRRRPAIAKEFDRLGRDMPVQLVPPIPARLGAQSLK